MKKAILVVSIVCLTLVIFTCGCIEQKGSGNTVTLIHSEQMFDFSTGQIVTEPFSTEDIDMIPLDVENKVRLWALNGAEIKVSGDAEYSSTVDVSAGTECILKDNEGGIATFTVTAIGENAEGKQTTTITWSYSPAG